jgi:hypothetical protein
MSCGNSYEGPNTPIINKSDGCCSPGSLIEYDEFVKNSTSLIQNGTVKLVTAMKIMQDSYYKTIIKLNQ